MDVGVSTPVSVSNVGLICDGVGLTANPLTDIFCRTVDGTFSQTYVATYAQANTQLAVQALMQDAAAGPFFLDNTEVASLEFIDALTGVVTTSYTLGDDASLQHTLCASAISFCGGTYASLFIGSNGYVTFDHGSTDFSETPAEFFNGIGGGPNPAVAVVYSDLNRGGVASGATYDVTEDAGTGIVTVDFLNQNWWGNGPDPAGNFSCTFGTAGSGSVTIDLIGLVASPDSLDGWIFGVTDGVMEPLGVGPGDVNLSDGAGTGLKTLGGYASVTPPESVMELTPATVVGAAGCVFNYIDSGGCNRVIF